MTDEEAVVKIGEHQKAIVESAQKTLFADFDSDLTEALGLAIGALNERKTGEWVPQYVSEPHWTGFVIVCYKCSCCDNYNIPPYRTKYCPNCGAKMEAEE